MNRTPGDSEAPGRSESGVLPASAPIAPIPLARVDPALGAPRAAPGSSALARPSGVGATDQEAVETWLAEYRKSPHTLRAYRRQAERFLKWCATTGRTLPGITRRDIDVYCDFLAAPPPGSVAPLGVRLADPPRPLLGKPHDDAALRYVLTILGSLFSYLTEARYLDANPVALIRRKGPREPRAGSRRPSLSRAAWNVLRAHLAAAPADDALAQRRRFIVEWLYFTAGRREDLAQATLASIVIEDDERGGLWWWRVLGKGGQRADIPLSDEAVGALRRYLPAETFVALADRGLGARLALPLVASPRNGGRGLSIDQIYDAVCSAGREAAGLARTTGAGAETIRQLEQLTPHALRRARATHLLDAGKDPRTVQRFLRHASIDTTLVYDRREARAFHAAVTRT